jgi:N-methylhydantoinase A
LPAGLAWRIQRPFGVGLHEKSITTNESENEVEAVDARVGIEVGGTFTDLVAFVGNDITISKVPSTPREPDRGACTALEQSGIPIGSVAELGHGSTVATNSVLERKGAKVAFVTSAGFRDLLLLQRHDRTSIYELAYRKPQPLVERRDCFEVRERTLADGAVLHHLDHDAIARELIPRLRREGYEAVAICLLNAYANPANEQALAAQLRQALPNTLVACSSNVACEFREYERASTTAMSAFVQPVIDRYLLRMEGWLAEHGFKGRLTVMQSNGGRLPASAMRSNAITALLSGPAAGVIGAVKQASRSGFHNLITFDMGGTSTDVCLVHNGEPARVHQTSIDGLPVLTSMLDIVTVGGGGGSIVWADDGGMLRVGPQSAGAQPGPACYGKGGDRPTITDAQVICGALRPEAFLGGRMPLDVDAARRAFAKLAAQFDTTVEGMAESAIRVVNANIVRAIQLVSTERGKDPRDCVLVPFGGGGPLHAAEIADALGVDTVVIPPHPGVISAYGLLASDFTKYAGVTRRMPLGTIASEGRAILSQLHDVLVGEFSQLSLHAAPVLTYVLDMRFAGQAFEVQVALSSLADLDPAGLRGEFHRAHLETYSHAGEEGRDIEVVSFRAAATVAAPTMPSLQFQPGPPSLDGTHPLFANRQWSQCRHSSGRELLDRQARPGPMVIGGATATIFVPNGWLARLDDHDNLILARNER